MTNTAKSRDNNKLICPECDTPLTLSEEISAGKIIECPACAIESEIVSLNPLILSPLEEEK